MSQIVYKACVENIRELKKHRKRINRLVNKAIREKQNEDLKSLTMMYALLYSAYAELSFLKLINTPGAFSDSEITQIRQSRNINDKWFKMIKFALNRYINSRNSGDIANKRKSMCAMLNDYIISPSHVRNKIAHGQWLSCLNNECTDINEDLTRKLRSLDYVQIDKYFCIYDKFQQCILDLVISPKAHYRDYYIIISDLESYVEETKKWSIESKISIILKSKKFANQILRSRK